LYGFETWFLTLREERRLSVFENRVLRKVFGPKMGGSNRELEKTTKRGAYSSVPFTKFYSDGKNQE
jgi:hypothetical protein